MTCGSPVDETLRDPGYLIIDRYHDLRLVPTIDVAFSFSIMRGDEQFRRRQRKQDRASGVFQTVVPQMRHVTGQQLVPARRNVER